MKKIIALICLLSSVSLFAQEKKDALKSYRAGRDFEVAGNMTEAKAKFQESVDICRAELQENSRNIESYVVITWSLIRLQDYRETVRLCNEALKINPKEYRIIETLGEAYFYLDNYTESLKNFENYLAGLPNGDRSSVAMFFMAEIYRLQGRHAHADIAYCAALYKEPGNSLWWYRLGRVRENANDKAGAKSAYERALRLRPNYPDAQEAVKRVS
ncbi:MAG: tetratricopeptide repeat protein [Treponema sp.]|nr:tetratricopeptide repeat protein [Treponema sp.]